MPSVSVTNTATLIIGANSRRQSIMIENEDSSVTVFIGEDSSVTASGNITNDGVGIAPGGTFAEDAGGTRVYKGDIYGIVASGTADVRYWERQGNI